MRIQPILHIFAVAALIAPLAARAEMICTPTLRIATQNYPGQKSIPPTNNLLLPAGKAITATGQQVAIQGRVLDRDCVPVKEATVELWQNSPTGRWLLAGEDDLGNAQPLFAGAGRTYTDVDGQFSFITAFPAPLNGRAPFVNIKVSGRGIADLTTALYYDDDARNSRDRNFTGSSAAKGTSIHIEENEDGSLLGSVTLVLGTRAPYRAY